HAIAHAEPETVAEHAPAPRETLYEQAARTHARHAPQAATRLEVDGLHPVGRRAPHPQDETLAVRNLVQAEKLERHRAVPRLQLLHEMNCSGVGHDLPDRPQLPDAFGILANGPI